MSTAPVSTSEDYVSSLVAHFTDSGQPGCVSGLRTAGIEALKAIGFPTPADEEWKYTNAAPIVRAQLLPADAASCDDVRVDAISFASEDWLRITVLDGRLCPDLSTHLTDAGVVCKSLCEAAASGDAGVGELGKLARPAANGFSAQNAAFFADGLYIRIPASTVVSRPIHIAYVATGSRSALFPRVLIVAEKSSQATIVETFRSQADGEYLTNAVSEIIVAENANIEFVRLQEESDAAYHISNTQARQQRDSRFTCTTVSLGSSLTRNDLGVVLADENCESDLNGLTILDGERHVDNHTMIDHASPNCASHELYKAVLDDRSRSVFNGKVIVRPDAQKTDARQTNRNLMLSNDAKVDTKPQLEIFADDVKCTHGATVGQLDDQQLFYLRSRGIGETVARQLLTFGFAYDIVKRIKLPAIQDYLDSVLIDALHTTEEFQTIHDNFRA